MISAHSESKLINNVTLIATILSNCASLYFAYVLIFILHDLCIVCVSIYIINFVNSIIIYTKLKQLTETKLKTN